MRCRTHILPAAMALALCAGAAAATSAPQLAATDGSQWLTPGKFNARPSVVLFWSPDCPPCRIELANLAALQAADPQTVFVLAAVGPRADSKRVLDLYPLPKGIRTAQAPRNPRGLLSRLGNRQGVLPFTVRFDGKGRACAAQTGPLTPDALHQMQQLCARPDTD